MDVLIVTTVVVLLACAAFVALVVPALKRQAPSKTLPKTPPKPEPGTIAPPAPDELAAPPTEAPVEELVEEPAAPALDVPEPTAGRLTRLRSRLARSQSSLGKGLLTLLSRDVLDESTWEEIEETLLGADLGVGPTQELVERLRTEVRVQGTRTPDQVRTLLRTELLALIGEDTDRSLHAVRCPDERPSVTLVVGVNGTGKTTTRLARIE